MDTSSMDGISTADREADGDNAPAQGSPAQRLLAVLLATLIQRTDDGSADWEVDDAHPESFCLVGDGWTVATRSVDADGQYPYALLVAGPTGETVLEVLSTSAFGRPLSKQFSRLHSAAAATAAMAGNMDLLGSIVTELRGQAGP